MSAPQILVIADDLTGAAEAAALGCNRGLSATVVTGEARPEGNARMTVFDTDSRLHAPHHASRAIRGMAQSLSAFQDHLVFKKTDSVLRGPVAAEVTALAEVFSRRLVLLVAGNPALGRTISGGVYRVAGVPLEQTGFSRDPHHPARSSNVVQLLGPHPPWPVHVLAPGQPMPATGLVLGEVSHSTDLDHWAGRVDDSVLPAGSSVFLDAVLAARGLERVSTPAPGMRGPVLVVSGTAARTTRDALDPRACSNLPGVVLAPALLESAAGLDQLAETCARQLVQQGGLVLLPPAEPVPLADGAQAVREALSRVVAHLMKKGGVRSLVIEGGSTAARILHELRWHTLDAIGEHAPGVATLRPHRAPACCVTLKPGTYPWPARWWSTISAAAAAAGTAAPPTTHLPSGQTD